MVLFLRLTTGCQLLLLVFVAALSTGQSASDIKYGPVQTTGVPLVIPTANTGSIAQLLTTGKPAVELTMPAASKVEIKVPTTGTVAPHQTATVPAKVTTVKPVVISIKAATNAPNPVVVVPTAKSLPATAAVPVASASVVDANQAPDRKMAQYFEPICQHLDQLNGEHMFKVQSQMKLFIEKTAGKMSVCFMQHYMIDPNLSPVDKTQLKKICSSRTSATDAKGSFKNFQSCARNNWDKNLDVELDRIIKMRENCFFNHSHSKNDSTISLLHDEELSLIGEVVGKVLRDNNQATNGKPNITLINLGQAPASSAPVVTTTTTSKAAPAALGTPSKTAAPPVDNQSAASKIMNDPNTLLVLVDDAPTTRAPAHKPAPVATKASGVQPPPAATDTAKATAAPAPASKLPVAAPAHAATLKPAAEIKLTIANPPATSVKPTATVLGEKIVMAVTTSAPKPPATTADPKLASATKITVAVASTVKPVAESAAPPAKLPATTTKPVVALASNTTPTPPTPPPTKAPATTKKPETPTTKASSATSSKPKTTPKAATSTAAPKTTKQPAAAKKEESKSKEQDQNKAKDAIKSLQKQRAGHVSDARMHQIEHERQMTIDPVGHTMKHKRYEEMKQQRTSTKGPASTTKKP